MIIAVLGTLKAGAAYVPLDPEYPKERLLFMAEDSGARIVVTADTLRDRLPESINALFLQSGGEDVARQPDGNPGVCVAPENLLYVIYTSGSTGRPKGSGLTHWGLSSLIQW